MERGSWKELSPSEGSEGCCSRAPPSMGPVRPTVLAVVGWAAPWAGSNLQLEEVER